MGWKNKRFIEYLPFGRWLSEEDYFKKLKEHEKNLIYNEMVCSCLGVESAILNLRKKGFLFGADKLAVEIPSSEIKRFRKIESEGERLDYLCRSMGFYAGTAFNHAELKPFKIEVKLKEKENDLFNKVLFEDCLGSVINFRKALENNMKDSRYCFASLIAEKGSYLEITFGYLINN